MDKNNKSTIWKRIAENRTMYLFISPFFIVFAIFGLFPIFFSLYLSLQEWGGVGEMDFIGFDNFKRLMQDTLFWEALINTISIALMSVIPTLIFALIISSLINLSITKFKGFFRIAYFLPYVTAIVAVVIIFETLFSTNYGFVNFIISLFGLEGVPWLQSSLGVKVTIAAMLIWQQTGYNIILYLAGLQRIPNQLYEAAEVDGANIFQTFFHITIPMLKPMILFTVIMSTIGGFQIFAEPQLLSDSDGTPIKGSMTLILHMYREAFDYYHFGYAATISWIVFLLIMFFSLINWILVERPKKSKEKGGKV